MEWFRGFDAHPKTRDEFRVRTLQGGVSTLVALVMGIWLVRCELRSAWSVETRDRLYVNSSHGAGVTVSFEIEFPRVACELIGVDAMEQSGQPMGFGQTVKKMRLESKSRKRTPFFATDSNDLLDNSGLGSTATEEHHFVENKSAIKCGDCYGAQDEELPCCSTCDEVRRAYRKKGWTFKSATVKQCQSESTARLLALVENRQSNDLNDRPGCVIFGDLRLPAVSGNFHFAPGRHVADLAQHRSPDDLVALTFAHFNVSHKIIKLNFLSGHNIFPYGSSQTAQENIEQHQPPSINENNKSNKVDDEHSRAKRIAEKRVAARKRRAASRQAKKRQKHKKRLHTSQLEGQSRVITDGYGMHQYYLKVVPTRYHTVDGHTIEAAQYSVTEHLRHVAPGSGRGLPGVFFFYEVSPVCAEVSEHRAGLPAFLTGLSAVVGGVYVTFGVLDRAISAFTQSISDGKTILTPRHYTGASTSYKSSFLD